MAMVCSSYGREHRILKRRTLALSFVDLICITSTVVFILVQFASIGFTYPSSSEANAVANTSTRIGSTESLSHNNISSNEHEEIQAPEIREEEKIGKESDVYPTSEEDEDDDPILQLNHKEETSENPLHLNNNTNDGCNSTTTEGDCSNNDEADEGSLYRTVMGARIALSIQLIIYITQLGFGIVLLIAAYHNDSRNLHLWVLFSEIIVVVLGLELFINFFGKFMWSVVVITGLYIVFKVFLIRLVRRFIHVNDLELTQFGSVGEFD